MPEAGKAGDGGPRLADWIKALIEKQETGAGHPYFPTEVVGLYDIIRVGDLEGQVKCWQCEMKHIHVGDRVPRIDNKDTYSIVMREGGFVNVIDGYINSWTLHSSQEFIYDKWGERVGV